MTFWTFIAFYIPLWCLVWMAVLPYGSHPSSKPAPGNDAGAPEKPRLGRKVLFASIITFLLMLMFHFLMKYGFINHYEITFPS